MAKLYFYYSAMNAGKTTTLLQSRHNYAERGMNTLVLKPSIDSRSGQGRVRSRIGLEADAADVDSSDDLFAIVGAAHTKTPVHCVLVDEAQFLTREQVSELTALVDHDGIPVLAYGLRTDFRGETFEGSQYLLAWADDIREIKAICSCG
ncbi:MAG: thymidine kinase, partial [Proteobacteria bacterium]|nr:thymidine kinase [Pseudomonadota bacterium]